MRKFAFWIVFLMLVCPAAWAQTQSFGSVFTLDIPDEWSDYSDLMEEEDMVGFVGSPMATELKMSLYIDKMAGWSGVDLREASEAEIQDFARQAMGSQENAELTEIRRVGEARIPFAMIRGKDETGDYAAAYTVLDGELVTILAYAYEDRYYKFTRELYDSDMRLFQNVLDTFQLVAKESKPPKPRPAAGEGIPSTTVLVYMSGSDLESRLGAGTEDIQEMIDAQLPQEGALRVLVQTGGARKWEMSGVDAKALCRFNVDEEGATLLETLPDASMGSADTLADFLAFGLEQAPADRYALVLWGHGSGLLGGICPDDRHWGDVLSQGELREALDEGLNGTHLDLIVFDACQMGSLEIAQGIAPYADIMIASQTNTSAYGLRYDLWLGGLAETPAMSSLEWSRLAIQTCMDELDHGIFTGSYAMSALDLRQTPAVSAAVDALYRGLSRRMERRSDEVLARRATLRSFGEEDGTGATDYVDAVSVANAFIVMEPGACKTLRQAVSRMVIACQTTPRMKGSAHGLSLTLPYAAREWFDSMRSCYGPIANESAYAKLIIEMIDAVESSPAA